MKEILLHKKTLIIAAICVVTFICFRYTLHNQFTNWDDDYYVTHDQWIKALTLENLKVIFTEDITRNNYHPFCMLSLAINYAFAQLNPMTYYLTNILIHVANVLLVFLLFFQICKRLKMDEFGTLFVAGFGALWFGVHPMHVESVAWIAERKDVLYAFFYLCGLLAYLKYISDQNKKWYWATYALFIASCLSKPMAVMFPVALLCVDFLFSRPLDKKLINEKIIFFASSLICGGMAFYTQNKTGAIAKFEVLTLSERVMYASYGFVMYVSKLFNPTYLSTFYPYPFRYVDGSLNSFFYAAPFLAIAIITVPLILTYKYQRAYFRIAVFGMGFFVANVIFILQFISVGAAIMADRYSYVSYIGLIFLVAYFLQEFIRKNPFVKMSVIIILLLLSSMLAYLCYERTFAWHDSETLLSDAIEKYPFKKDMDKPHDHVNSGIALLSYKWLGNYYLDKGDPDKALECYNILALLHSSDKHVDENIARANALKIYGVSSPQQTNNAGADGNPNSAPNTGANQGQIPGNTVPAPGNMPAMMPFNRGLPANSAEYIIHINKSIALCKKGDTLMAFREYINSFRLNPNTERVMADSAFHYVQTGQYGPAINMYGMLLKLSTANPFYYFYRGVAEFSKNKMHPAIEDWQVAVKVKSLDVQKSASFNLAVALDSVGNDSLAYYYAIMSKGLGWKIDDVMIEKYKRKRDAKRK